MFKKRKDISIQRDQGVYLAQDAQKDAEIVRRELNVPLTGFTTRGTQTEIYRIKELTEIYGRQNLCAKVFIQTKTMWGLDQVEGNCPIDEAVKINNLLALDGYCPRIYDVVKISGRTALITDFLAGDHQAKEFSDDRFEFVEQQKDHPLNWINGKFVDLQGAKFRQYEQYRAEIIDEARGFADWPVGSKQLYQTIPGLAGQRDTEERLQKWGIKRFEGDTLLDVGCNLGMFCRKASEDGVKRVFGIDTPEVVNVAQKLAILDGFYNIDFIGLDLKNTHFSQIARMTGFNYFDTILFLAMSAHIGMPAWIKNCTTLIYEGHGSERPFKVYHAPNFFKQQTQILYYPSPCDELWNAECATIMPFCFGHGIDVGCGGRSIKKNIVRCDIDVKKNPEILSSADKIPVKDSSFDYLVAMHILEHFKEQEPALKEWVRVVKNKGYICIIHPDLSRTGPQKPVDQNPSLRNDPYNKHYHERSLDNFINFMKKNQKLGYRLFSFGDVGNFWSNFAILRVTKGTS